jgi:hypothetical protein
MQEAPHHIDPIAFSKMRLEQNKKGGCTFGYSKGNES